MKKLERFLRRNIRACGMEFRLVSKESRGRTQGIIIVQEDQEHRILKDTPNNNRPLNLIMERCKVCWRPKDNKWKAEERNFVPPFVLACVVTFSDKPINLAPYI